jgi:hypothetical protein
MPAKMIFMLVSLWSVLRPPPDTAEERPCLTPSQREAPGP